MITYICKVKLKQCFAIPTEIERKSNPMHKSINGVLILKFQKKKKNGNKIDE